MERPASYTLETVAACIDGGGPARIWVILRYQPVMFRRGALKAAVATLSTGLAGCLGGRTPGADTPTAEPPTDDPRSTTENGDHPIEYLVRNDDDETHQIAVTIENAEGTVVHRKTDEEFVPDEQLGATFSPADTSKSPYPVTVSLDSLSLTIEWKPEECVRFDLLVAVTSNGQLEVEREECVK